VRFMVKDNRVSSFRIDYLDTSGLAMWTR
jgi:hypothetical protein